MSGTQERSAARLKNAQVRLGAAIERLDGVFDCEVERGRDVEVKALRSENATLKKALGQATSRLDAVISKIKT